jgi:hypothetical protein
VKTRPRKRSARQVIVRGRFVREDLQFSTAKNVPVRK